MRRTYSAEPTAVRRARHAVMAELFEHGAMTDEIERAAWAVSDVATAMLSHARQLEVTTEWAEERVRVEICTDDAVHPLSVHRDSRRSLVQVLQHTADAWGTGNDDSRSTVWFDVAVPETIIDLRTPD